MILLWPSFKIQKESVYLILLSWFIDSRRFWLGYLVEVTVCYV